MPTRSNKSQDETAKEKKLLEFLGKYKDREFVRRILDPSLNKTPVQNPDGTTSTHSMAAEVDNNGNWFVFPTVINVDGKLTRMPDPQTAFRENAKRGEFIPFGKDKDAAIRFSQSYKTKRFNNYQVAPNAQSSSRRSLSDLAIGNR